MMTTRYAIASQKGGSCKTTTAVNLAAALGELGVRVLVIDLDPQASATAWLGVSDGGDGLLQAITERGTLAELVIETATDGVDLIPSSTWLAHVERRLVGEPGAELILRELIAELPDRWGAVLIDCPPSLGLLTVSALAAVDGVIVPVEPSPMALQGVAALRSTVAKVGDRLNPGLEIRHVLACRVDRRTRLAQDVLASLSRAFGDRLMGSTIRETVRLREASGFGQPITAYDPQGAGAEDYRAAARELIGQTTDTTDGAKDDG